VVSLFTENALYSLWQLIAYKYVCAASQLFFFQQLVSAVGFSVYSTVDRRTGKRIALIVSFAKCLISVKKTRRTDGRTSHDGIYTACINSRGKNRHFYVPGLHFWFVLGTPLWQSRKTLHEWKDNSMLAKRLAACTYLSWILSELYDAYLNA